MLTKVSFHGSCMQVLKDFVVTTAWCYQFKVQVTSVRVVEPLLQPVIVKFQLIPLLCRRERPSQPMLTETSASGIVLVSFALRTTPTSVSSCWECCMAVSVSTA